MMLDITLEIAPHGDKNLWCLEWGVCFVLKKNTIIQMQVIRSLIWVLFECIGQPCIGVKGISFHGIVQFFKQMGLNEMAAGMLLRSTHQ